jgi:hypothetical protein
MALSLVPNWKPLLDKDCKVYDGKFVTKLSDRLKSILEAGFAMFVTKVTRISNSENIESDKTLKQKQLKLPQRASFDEIGDSRRNHDRSTADKIRNFYSKHVQFFGAYHALRSR